LTTASPLVVLAGTRPECLKLTSLVRALRARLGDGVVLMSSGQHPTMVRSTFAQWGIAPDCELMAAPQPSSLSGHVRWIRDRVRAAAGELGARVLLVQGDTSTAYAGALAAKALDIELVHVEAGLRTADPMRPFPEELFRRRIGGLADWHFAPTALAARNLISEGIAPARVQVSGNTGVDALRLALETRIPAEELAWRDRFDELLVLTLHRRENYGPRLEQICVGVRDLLDLHPRLGVVCPVHPNPAVGARVRRVLAGHPRVWLTAPLDYRPFVQLLSDARLVVTDSGGIQEEAPYLGVPVVVARENTERPEALSSGNTRLVAAEAHAVMDAAQALLAAPRPRPLPFTADAPFGDGRAGERIADTLCQVCPALRKIAGEPAPTTAAALP
jgi:UDP-N-acetylglucosamine 2-epimerase (non-hydrolysing)